MAAEKITPMYSPLRLAQKYLWYYLTAANGKGHGIHSPFVFDFVTKLLNDSQPYAAYEPIERLRRRLHGNNTMINLADMGAGSAYKSAMHTRSIADIAKRAAKPRRLGQLLYRVARHYKPTRILELGTSLGISTAYLAADAPAATVYTIEGAPAIAALAGDNLQTLGLPAKCITGSFDDVLPNLLPAIHPIDLVFIDGNHRQEPTLHYFNLLLPHLSKNSILIFDDIHWSAEMEAAWATIKADPHVLLTIDLFFL